jgi:hypothetical protein
MKLACEIVGSRRRAAFSPDCDLSLRFGWRNGRLLYSPFAETCRAFGRIDFAARLRRLFDLLKSRAIAGGADNLSQRFTRSFHRDQSLKQNKKLNHLCEDSG